MEFQGIDLFDPSKIPDSITNILSYFESKLPDAEFRLVGGCIRDLILDRQVKDWDVVTTANPEDIVNVLKLEPTGKSFPVFRYKDVNHTVEVACCRTERSIGVGHTEFETTICNSFEEDSIRRDLTINACSWSLKTPSVVYYYSDSTEDDFKNKLLRECSAAFSEDPLRVFRAARFATLLNFGLSDSLVEICRNMVNKGVLNCLPPERVLHELELVVFSGGHLPTFLSMLAVFEEVYWFGNLLQGSALLEINFNNTFLSDRKCILYTCLALSDRYLLLPRTRAQYRLQFSYIAVDVISEVNAILDADRVMFDDLRYESSYKRNEAILKVCQSFMRGKLHYKDYIFILYQYSIHPSVCNLYELVISRLKELKFSSLQSKEEILSIKHSVVNELYTLFIGDSNEKYD